ncbi:hypothetical protein D0Y65_040643 [Glycine soja]|uniref:Uncharacterized protein n=1 Tax=Glycine soja TaxID=3848 RepID=A0A445GS72_GLYSO|nr:hypothetical protein D0Y65_040643 [Glycine soja]
MRNREKKVKPIACHVIPWRSLGSGVGRMFRHQYLLVKQKIKRPEFSGSEGGGDCDDVSGKRHCHWRQGSTRHCQWRQSRREGCIAPASGDIGHVGVRSGTRPSQWRDRATGLPPEGLAGLAVQWVSPRVLARQPCQCRTRPRCWRDSHVT